MPTLELFHQIVDASSARVRRFIVDHELESHVRFRNLAFDEVRADWQARGAPTVPSLWDGERLHVGADAVIARLQAFSDVGRS